MWNIIGSATIALIGTWLLYSYILFRKKETREIKDFFAITWNSRVFLFSVVVGVVSLVLFLLGTLYYGQPQVQGYLNQVVFLWLVSMGCVDAREQIIPNHLIGVGLLFWVVFVAVECIGTHIPLKNTLTYSLIGGGACGIVLLLIALISKSALGMGDVKMLTVLGLLFGLADTYTILLMSIIIMAVVSIILMIMKKADRKTSIPMAPFVTVGFLLCVLIGI